MARTRLNPRLAKQLRTYDVEDVASLYGIHRNTVRRWIVDQGLPTIDGRRPLLIHGSALRRFLENRRAAARRPTSPGLIYCLKCREPRPPAAGMADFIPGEGGKAGDLRALCATCGTLMHRRTRFEAVAAVLPGIEVRVAKAAPRIAGTASPCLNGALKKD